MIQHRILSALSFLALIFVLQSGMPTTAQATMLGPCDHAQGWSTLKLGDKDMNESDIGPIMGLQQMIGESDVVNTFNLGGMGPGVPGVFDEPTRALLAMWQLKHGIITDRMDAEAGSIGPKTMRVVNILCSNATNARGDRIGSGDAPTITYTLYYPKKNGGFLSLTSYPAPKYTPRVADQALRILLGGGGQFDTAVAFNPFSSYALSREMGINIDWFKTADLAHPKYDVTYRDLHLDVYYQGISLENGIATINFDSRAEVFFERADLSNIVYESIEKTLRQFPTITGVRIQLMRDDHYHAILARTIAGLRKDTQVPTTTSCLELTQNLVLGSTDARTKGEVSKLQKFIFRSDTGVTGYYGQKTAHAVVLWQKAHGMSFVTTVSGVGKMTRAKLAEGCTKK